MGEAEDLPGEMSWSISVPIFKNRFLLKQLGLAAGIPFGILIIILILVLGRDSSLLYVLVIIAALFFFTWLFILVVYGGKHNAEFYLDPKGALFRTQEKEGKKNRIINTLVFVLGLLSGKPVVAGAGALAQSRQQLFIRWNRVMRVKYEPRSRTILLRAGWLESIGLFCTSQNYAAVEQYVRSKTKHLDGGLAGSHRSLK